MTDKKDEALKLALEALEGFQDDNISASESFEQCNAAITALREALTSVPDWASEAKEQPAPATELREQEPVAWRHDMGEENGGWEYFEEASCPECQPLYTSPQAQRKPLTHEQRVDLLAKFEAHKHEWHAPAILIDMVEAAHGITGEKT